PLYAFCARMAATVPQASEDFREQLLARLVARAEEHAPAAQPAANGHKQGRRAGSRTAPTGASGDSSARSRRAEPARFLERLRSAAPVAIANAPRARRFASALAGVVGAALMLAFFLGMAAVIKLRTDAVHGSQTATAVAKLP